MSEKIPPKPKLVDRPPMPTGFRLREFPDQVLKQVSEPVSLSVTAKATIVDVTNASASTPVNFMPLPEFINKLIQAMYSMEDCAGLAAVQIGVPIRLLVYNLDHQLNADQTVIMINPEIVEQSVETNKENELCFSLRDQYCLVERYNHITVKYLDEKLEECELKIDEPWHSRIVQHEIDHLDGKLNFERLSKGSRQIFFDKYYRDQKARQRDLKRKRKREKR